MCISFAVAGESFRVAATDLGFGTDDADEWRVWRGRLTRTSTGWLVGGGEARTVRWSLESIEDPTDTGASVSAVEAAAKKAAAQCRDPEALWEGTHILSADLDGVCHFRPDGDFRRLGEGSYLLMTPSDMGEREADRLEQTFARNFDPQDMEITVQLVREILTRVAGRSDVTCPQFSVGVIELQSEDGDDPEWHRLELEEV